MNNKAMTEYQKLQKTLERIANWTPLTEYSGIYEELDIARLNLKHIQRYAKDALKPTEPNELMAAFRDFCLRRKISTGNDDYILCIRPDESGLVTGPGGFKLFSFYSLSQCKQGLETNADPNVVK